MAPSEAKLILNPFLSKLPSLSLSPLPLVTSKFYATAGLGPGLLRKRLAKAEQGSGWLRQRPT